MADHLDFPNAGADDAQWEALARYQAGECTPEEASRVRAWIGASDNRRALAAGLAALGGATVMATPIGVQTEGALAKVHARMRRESPDVLPLRPKVAAAPRPRRWLPRAAAAALVLTAGGAWFAAQRGRAGATSETRVVATTVGERQTVDLPDGSRVLLGPSSRLTVGTDFATARRTVRLEGVALFTVKHDAAHPFTVEAQGTRITDVGTEFSVRSDEGYGVHVAVREGAVEVRRSAEGSPALLHKGDRAIVGADDVAQVERGTASEDDFDFARGALVFREAPLARVVADVRRWYGVEIVPGTAAMAQRHVTATFSTESRAEALKVIALALGAEVDMRGDSALLRPRILRPPR